MPPSSPSIPDMSFHALMAFLFSQCAALNASLWSCVCMFAVCTRVCLCVFVACPCEILHACLIRAGTPVTHTGVYSQSAVILASENQAVRCGDKPLRSSFFCPRSVQ